MSTIIFHAKTELKKRRFKHLTTLAFSASFIFLLSFLSLPILSRSFSNTAPQPTKPNHFATYLNHRLDWEILNDFKLIIPKLDLNVDVKPSVDILNPKTWQTALKQGVAHAQGSNYPNQPGTVYIFGHSTDYPWNIKTYNALFYSLNDLEPEAISGLITKKPGSSPGEVFYSLKREVIGLPNLSLPT